MVVVGMGDEQSVNLTEFLAEHLLTEIRTAVNDDACLFRLHHCRAAQTSVMRVVARADLATAANSRHTNRCSGSKKSQSHFYFKFRVTLYNVHLRVYVDAEFVLYVLAYMVAEANDIVASGTALVN